MKKMTSLLAGLGLGAAAGYADKQERLAREARMAALLRGEPLPKEVTPIEKVIGNVKDYFKPGAAPAAVPAVPAVPVAAAQSIADAVPVVTEPPVTAPVAAVTPDTSVPLPLLDAPNMPSAETVAFNDNATVPNAPTPFTSSYG